MAMITEALISMKKSFAGSGAQLVKIALGLFLWLFIGTIFYLLIDNCAENNVCVPNGLETNGVIKYTLSSTQSCGWTFGESFYYSVQTGLSIGFGVLVESRDASRLFSCYHILAGASFIGGALGLFANKAIGHLGEIKDDAIKNARDAATKLGSDEVKSMPPHELAELLVKHPEHARRIVERVEPDDAKVDERMALLKNLPAKQRCEHVAALLHEAGHIAETDKNTLHSRLKKAFGPFASCNAFPATTFVTGLFLFWVLIGIVYGLVAEEWTFITSLYFAISSLSTAGLQGVTVYPQWHTVFCGIYCLIGVPIYGACLGLYANCLVASYFKAAQLETINGALDLAETDMVESLLDHHKDPSGADTISLAEFTILELIRLGATDSARLSELKDSFKSLDGNNSGFLKREEMWPEMSRDKKRQKQAYP